MLGKNNSDARPRAKTCLKWVRDEQRFWIFEHFCKIRMENWAAQEPFLNDKRTTDSILKASVSVLSEDF